MSKRTDADPMAGGQTHGLGRHVTDTMAESYLLSRSADSILFFLFLFAADGPYYFVVAIYPGHMTHRRVRLATGVFIRMMDARSLNAMNLERNQVLTENTTACYDFILFYFMFIFKFVCVLWHEFYSK